MQDPIMLNFMAAFDSRYAADAARLRTQRHQWRGATIDSIPAELLRGAPSLSHVRAKIAAMNGDAITAGMWALAGFDPALVHVAELREHFRHLPEDDQIRVAIDRLISVYVEGQCRELIHAAGITTNEASVLVGQNLTNHNEVTYQILDCSSDPLALEICGYAMWLGVLTGHGQAPWNRFAAVIGDCHAQLVTS